MPDMDLREVLDEALHDLEDCPGRGTWPCPDDYCYQACVARAARVVARLSQPDVLDEFERRVAALTLQKAWALTPTNVRLVFSDMLGGGS